jgi:large subunit ribosomal protein L17
MAVIELVTESVEDSRKANAKSAGPAKKAPAKKVSSKAAAASAAPVASEPVEESPAEELVSDTEELDSSTGEQQAPSDDTAEEEAEAYGEGSYRGTEPPTGYDIKGNENSMKYHTPESPYYEQTIAEVWFNSEQAAEAAGFEKAG